MRRDHHHGGTPAAGRLQQTDLLHRDALRALRRNGYRTFADLAGRTVASLAGTSETGELNAANRQRKLNIAILLCREDVEAFAAVKTERAAAYVMDDVLLAGVMANWASRMNSSCPTTRFVPQKRTASCCRWAMRRSPGT